MSTVRSDKLDNRVRPVPKRYVVKQTELGITVCVSESNFRRKEFAVLLKHFEVKKLQGYSLTILDECTL